MNQSTIDPSQTIKTHLREKTPAEKLAEHDAAAAARNSKQGLDSRPASVTEPEKEASRPTTVALVIGAALSAAIDWQSKGVDLKTVEVPGFLDQVAEAAKVDPTLVIGGNPDPEELPLVKSLRETIAEQLSELNKARAAGFTGDAPDSETESAKPEAKEETSEVPSSTPTGEKKTFKPSGPPAKKVPKKKASNSDT